LETHTKGESIFHSLEEFFKENEILICNNLSVLTYGAPATTKNRGFIALKKKNVSNVLSVHFIIHRQHLVAKNLSEWLHKSLNNVIIGINKIKNN
jgi:hypothetical protein